MNVTALVRLFTLFIKRTESSEAYFRFQVFQAQFIIDTLVRTLDLKPDDRVCDFGCGRGGYAHVLAGYFSRVDAVDFYIEPQCQPLDGLTFYACDLMTYRAAEPYDCVFCASVIEHIPPARRREFIRTIADNLRPGAALYLSFPPFLSLIGGHKVAPFHYLPDKAAFMLARICKKGSFRSYDSMYGAWGLHKTYIGDIRQLLEDNGFAIQEISSRYMPRWYVTMFRHNNFFNWHAEFFARRRH